MDSSTKYVIVGKEMQLSLLEAMGFKGKELTAILEMCDDLKIDLIAALGKSMRHWINGHLENPEFLGYDETKRLKAMFESTK